jgi:hypothetical protein
MKIFLIQNRNDCELFWSNDYGWVKLDGDVTVFTVDERYNINLPAQAAWVEFKEVR